jgi:hypothetical protein
VERVRVPEPPVLGQQLHRHDPSQNPRRKAPPGAEESAAVAEIVARAAGETAATPTAAAKGRSLANGETDIRAAVQASLLEIRGAVLPGVQRAVAADGGVKGFAAHLGRLAKALSKGSGSGSGSGTATMGKMGMMRRKS